MEDIEAKKCTVLALASGAERLSQGQPKRSPSRQRIDVLASRLRLGDLLGAEKAYEYTMEMDTNAAREIQSIRRDILSSDRESDYQALGLFILPSDWEYLASEVAAIEIQEGNTAHFHSYPACPISNISQIFLIDKHGHVMCGKPTASTSETTWKDWRSHGAEKRLGTSHPIISWKQRLL